MARGSTSRGGSIKSTGRPMPGKGAIVKEGKVPVTPVNQKLVGTFKGAKPIKTTKG